MDSFEEEMRKSATASRLEGKMDFLEAYIVGRNYTDGGVGAAALHQ